MTSRNASKTGPVTVFGYGATGKATVERLAARGQAVRVVQRKRPVDLPAGVEFQACDVLDGASVLAAMRGVEQAVVTIGFEYKSAVWRKAWPKAMANLIAAAEATGARIVHIDNLYMYGPQPTHQNEALREDMKLTRYGRKPAVRAQVTRQWMEAASQGRVKWAALRAPDFFGPGVMLSHLGETGFAKLGKGESAMLLMHPDNAHAFAYVPDVGKAAVMLLDAPDDAYGQAWHAPCAPARSPRQILEIGAKALGQKLRVIAIPGWMLSMLGTVIPFMSEYAEMSFTWRRPYHVDSSKFTQRFGLQATPIEVSARETALAFRAEAEAVATAGTSPVHASA